MLGGVPVLDSMLMLGGMPVLDSMLMLGGVPMLADAEKSPITWRGRRTECSLFAFWSSC